MVVVILIATGAAVCLKLYKAAQSAGGDVLSSVLFSIRQQAGVMAALSATVFAVLTALTTGKSATPLPAVPAVWGQRPAGTVAAS